VEPDHTVHFPVLPLRIGCIASAYFILAGLGNLQALTALPSPVVWLPSGIGLAAILLSGYRIWPGIWLGAFAASLWISTGTAGPPTLFGSVGLAASIGVGAALQALFGGAVVRRFVGPSLILHRGWDVVKFMLLGGPVSCMVTATTAMGYLLVTGGLPWSEGLFSWWTWWVGDVMGVLVLTPIFLTLADILLPPVMNRTAGIKQTDTERTVAVGGEVCGHKLEDEMVARHMAFFAGLFDASPDIVFLKDKHGVYLGCNAPFVAFAGCSREEIIGKTDYDLFARETAEFFHEHDRLTLEHLESRHDQELIDYPDGRRILADTLRTPVRDEQGALVGLLGVGRDVTERKRVEEDLRQTNNYLENIFESSPDAIGIVDALGNFIRWNKIAEDLYGYTFNDMRGKSAFDIYEDKDELKAMLARLHQDGSVKNWEMRMKRGDGSILLAELSISLLRDDQGRTVGSVCVARDLGPIKATLAALEATNKRLEQEIIERKRAEEAFQVTNELTDAMNRELAEAIDRANQMTAQADSANIAKSEFLANMSHEIRTPMNGVIGMTGVLLDTDLTDEQREYAELIQKSGDALLGVINDILDFSKIEAGKLEVELIDFDLRMTLDDLIDVLAMRAYEKGLEFACLVDAEVPSLVHGDPGRLRQVLINLVGNGVKFTSNGEIVVHVTLDREDDEEALVRFSVTDTGIGIPKDKVGALFQPFTQVDGSVTRKYGGTGLGLSISRQLVEMMGGEIGVESEHGKGSMFWFTIRLGKQASDTKVEEEPIEDLSDVRVLAADNNLTNRLVLAAMLESWCCRHEELAEAASVLERLRFAAAAGDPFSVAILDMQMPELDGETLVRSIKEDPSIRDTILVTMTSIGKRGDAARFEKAGFAAYLTKPVKRSQLHGCLVTSLGRAKGGAVSRGHIITRHSVEEDRKRRVRILLAEDNITNQKVALKILEKLGYSADTAANGAEALAAVESRLYDLVLMDVQMPEMDGFEATRRIRSLGSSVSRRDLPIIAMTAHAVKGYSERCLEAGMNDYVSKPISAQDLASAITRWTSPSGPPMQDRTLGDTATDGTEVFDRTDLLDRLGGDEDMLIEVMETFFEDMPRQISALQEAVERSHAPDVRLHAHTIKGASANLGALRLKVAAGRLENAAESGDLIRAWDGLKEIKVEFDTFRQAVSLASGSRDERT
jgi:PAS domain S-box-containing protein